MARQALAATNPRFRAAVLASGLDPDDALTMAQVAARTGLSAKTVARNARHTVRVRNKRVTTGAWLRAWVEVWYPERAGTG